MSVVRLDGHEKQHLHDLVVCARRTVAPASSTASSPFARPSAMVPLETLRPHPALLLSRAMDALATNPSGLRLFPGLETWPAEKRNTARWAFLDPSAPSVIHNWEDELGACVGRLLTLAGIEPEPPGLSLLVEDLLRESPTFARLWQRYDVRMHPPGSRTLHHPSNFIAEGSCPRAPRQIMFVI